MKNHPTRKELIDAARSGQVPFVAHLEKCKWCKSYFELLQSYSFAGELMLSEAPAAWLEKAVAVGDKPVKSGIIETLLADISFDSWALPVPGGVRGEGLVQERRLCFESENIIFDLRAENCQKRWDFIARITDSAGTPSECRLIAEDKELKADEEGFYQWTAVRPPKQFKIISESTTITTPELSWKKSQPEN